VHFLELADGHAGIDLGRGEVVVAQQSLDEANIGAVLQHVSGAGVAEEVAGSA
jgi:hypothetical protein